MKNFCKIFGEVAQLSRPGNDPFIEIFFDDDANKYWGSIGLRGKSNFENGHYYEVPRFIETLAKKGIGRWDEDLHEYPMLEAAQETVFWVASRFSENGVLNINIVDADPAVVMEKITELLTELKKDLHKN